MFLYREKELEILESDFFKPSASFNFIFGRRKVGKTTLLNQYLKDKNNLYLNCFETMPNLLVSNLKITIDEFFNKENDIEINDFEGLFTYISNQNIENKIVIVLENINNILKIDKNFISNFYLYWNKYLKNKNIQFILTSSLFSSLKEDLKIFERANNIIKLKSLPYNIIEKLFPDLDKKEQMYLYSTFGTNFQYLKNYDSNKDFIENLKELCLPYDSLIFNEGMTILKSDLSDVITYSSILYAIAMGNKKIGDIALFLDLKSSYLTRYMQKLVDLMILDKTVPINENPLQSKFGRYEIEDNFLKFWFCYIYPNSSILLKNDLKKVIKLIENDFEEKLVKSAYEKYLLKQIKNEPEKYLDFIPNELGSWWNNKDDEIYIIAYNIKYIIFIDINWKKIDNKDKLYSNLENKAANFKTTLIKRYMIIDSFLNLKTNS